MRRDPAAADPRLQRYQIDQNRRRVDHLAQEDVRIEGDRRLIMRSPDGTFWNITISNAGVLSTGSDVGVLPPSSMGGET